MRVRQRERERERATGLETWPVADRSESTFPQPPLNGVIKSRKLKICLMMFHLNVPCVINHAAHCY